MFLAAACSWPACGTTCTSSGMNYVAIPEDPAYSGQYYFFYYSIWRPPFCQIWIGDDTWFDVDVIDTWNMTVTSAGRHKGRFEVPLPGTQYIGIRLRRVDEK